MTLRNILLILLAFHILLIGTLHLFDDKQVAMLLAGARVSIGGGIVVAYAPIIWKSRHGIMAPGEVLAAGIVLTWLSSCVFGAYTALLQAGLVGPNAALISWDTMMIDLSGALHLAVAASIEGRVPLQGWMKAGITVALGVAAAFGLIFSKLIF
jgi:hypothetical protein